MATPRKDDRAINDENLPEFLSLIKGADSVELKLTIPESDHLSALQALNVDALGAQIRQVFFFDTPDLDLNKAGVVARARRVQGKEADTTIKLRPIVPAELPKAIRKSPNFGVEVDAMKSGFVCSGSMKAYLDNAGVRDAAKGGRTIRSMFSKEQRALFAEHAPEGMDLNDLSILGPLFVLKLKFAPEDFNRSMVAELWLYPDGSRLLELSTKCPPAETFMAVAEARAYLASKGIAAGGEQTTKTKKALDYFSKKLKAEQAPKATTTRTRKPATKSAG